MTAPMSLTVKRGNNAAITWSSACLVIRTDCLLFPATALLATELCRLYSEPVDQSLLPTGFVPYQTDGSG